MYGYILAHISRSWLICNKQNVINERWKLNTIDFAHNCGQHLIHITVFELKSTFKLMFTTMH